MKKNECAIHGPMTNETAYECKNKDGSIRLRCIQCCKDRRMDTKYRDREKNIERASIWKKANRERVNAAVKADRIVNPEKYARWAKSYRERNREDVNTREICRQRGMNIEIYREMQAKQNNKCAICNLEEVRISRGTGEITRLCVDHDHETGAIRELLCHDCNTAIGKFKDSPELLYSAADYLIRHNEKFTWETIDASTEP